jgi:hypothetical protein
MVAHNITLFVVWYGAEILSALQVPMQLYHGLNLFEERTKHEKWTKDVRLCIKV